MAICKVFYKYCADNNIVLKDGNFTLSYDTNIPRQVKFLMIFVIAPKLLKYIGAGLWAMGIQIYILYFIVHILIICVLSECSDCYVIFVSWKWEILLLVRCHISELRSVSFPL